MKYQVVRRQDGSYALSQLTSGMKVSADAVHAVTNQAVLSADEREAFDQWVEAAMQASADLEGANVHWMFNSVCLETDMQHKGDFWAIYTELNAEAGN